MTVDDHHNRADASVACAVVTISDTRTPETDKSGEAIRHALLSAGHRVIRSDILPDEATRIAKHLSQLCDDPTCDVILSSGGTGLAHRDTTYEAVQTIIEKRIEGFGELFRMLSYEQVGAAAMLSRAVAGTAHGTLIFSMPGAPRAVQLAMSKLIVPELAHAAALLRTKKRA